MIDLVVLGCGWSGVVVSIHLKSLYPAAEVICVDKSLDGGLLNSINIGPYTFDIGGSHVLFSKSRDVIEGIRSLGGEWISRSRNAYVLLDGVFIPYPFENGIYVLPPERRVRYGLSLIGALIRNREERRPANFLDWIIMMFGDEIARDYLIPYNEKIWKRPLNELTADWVYTPGRLPIPSLEDVVKAIAGIPTVGYAEQSMFYYPRRGGIKSQWNSAFKRAQKLGVKFVRDVVSEVRVLGKNEFVINGRIRAGRLVSTIAIRDLVQMIKPEPPEDVLKAASRLDYNSLIVVGIGLRSQAPPHHWVYVPDRRYVFHRYAWVSNYGEDTPPGHSTLIAEVTIPPGFEVDIEGVKHEVVQGLIELGVVKECSVDLVRAWFHRYGYPIYTLTHGQDTQTIEQYLAQMGIKSFGRWGNWQYWNTDTIYQKQKLRL